MLDAVGAERHADAHFLRALLHGVGHEAVDADGGEDERGCSEDGEQEHVEVLARGGVDDDFFHGADAGDGKAAAGLAQLFGDGGDELVRVSMGADEPDDGADAGVERGHAVGHLRLRDDHERARVAVEAAVVNVADDADDLARGLFKLRADSFADDDLLADRIFLGPVFLGHGLVDEDNAGRSGCVLSLKSRPRRMGILKTSK